MNFTINPCTEGDAEYIWEMDEAESVCAGSCSDGSEELLLELYPEYELLIVPDADVAD